MSVGKTKVGLAYFKVSGREGNSPSGTKTDIPKTASFTPLKTRNPLIMKHIQHSQCDYDAFALFFFFRGIKYLQYRHTQSTHTHTITEGTPLAGVCIH